MKSEALCHLWHNPKLLVTFHRVVSLNSYYTILSFVYFDCLSYLVV